MEKQIIDIAEIIMAAILLTILLMVTQKKWAGGKKLILIFVGACISGYLFSGIPGYFAPELYNSGLRTALNGGTTILSFMALVYIFEKDLLRQAFATITIKYLSDNNDKKGTDD